MDRGRGSGPGPSRSVNFAPSDAPRSTEQAAHDPTPAYCQSRRTDLAFYPVYFSQDIPSGIDMALEYEGSTVCQSRSALGGSCGAPWKETKIRTDHRQVPVYIQGRWISVDCKLARLVRRVNQIPGIASLRSCQGGIPDAWKSRHNFPTQAYLSVVPAQYTWVDFDEYRCLEALRRTPVRAWRKSLVGCN